MNDFQAAYIAKRSCEAKTRFYHPTKETIMQNHSTPDTPFAEVLHAAQAGEMEISWQKTAPVTESERNAARQLKRTFGYTLPVPVLLTAVVCYLVPHLFFDGGKLFLPTIKAA